MDRADAPPDARVGGGFPARAAVRRRRGSVPRGAAVAAGAGGAVALARARVAARLRAAREARTRRTRCATRSRPGTGARRGSRWRRGSTRPWPAPGGATTAADPRPAHALGELLHERCDELQLAAAAGAAGDPRLRRRARGGPPGRAGPLTALLAPAGLTLPALARARGVAAAPRALAAPTPSGRSARPGIARPPPRRPPRARPCAVSPPPPTIPAERPSIRCFSGQRLGDRLQRLGQVVGRVEDARDEDQRQEDRVRVRGRRLLVRDRVREGDAERREADHAEQREAEQQQRVLRPVDAVDARARSSRPSPPGGRR